MRRVASTSRSPPSFKPRLNPVSVALVQQTRPQGVEKVEDRLLRLGRRIKAVREAKIEEILTNPQDPRSLDTVERLLQYQQIYRDHKHLLAKQCFDRPSFNPVINKLSAEIMAGKGKLDVARPRESRKPGPSTFPFQPKLNPASLRLAQRKGSSSSRLMSPQPKSDSEPGRECTFRPTINPSPGSDKGRKSPRWMALYEMNREQLEAKARARIAAEDAVIRPTTPGNVQPEAVVDRLLKWGVDRDSRRERKQKARTDPGLEECTFIPSVTPTQKFSNCESQSPDPSSQYWPVHSNTPLAQSFARRFSTEDCLRLDTRETLQLVSEEDSVDLEGLLRQLQG